MPNPPKPIERKRREGNAGKRKLPEPVQVVQGLDGTPKPPTGLQAAGKALWETVWTEGAGWLARTDLPLVTLLAETADERAEVRSELKKASRTFTSRTGNVRAHPLLGALRELDRQIIAGLSLLGFTPADRARLGLAQVRASSILDLARRRSEQRGK